MPEGNKGTHPKVFLDAEQISGIDAGKVFEAAVRLKNGDESAFNDIYGETLPVFSEAVRGECQGDPVYQDVLQVAYIRIERGLNALGPGENSAAEASENLGKPEAVDIKKWNADDFLRWMVSVLQDVLNRTLEQKEREVPEDLEEFLKIGKSIISSKDIKDFEKKKQAEEEKEEEDKIMSLH